MRLVVLDDELVATAQTRTADFTIHVAGDVDEARRICRAFCDEVGDCVTVTSTTYVYTGGEEAGVRVGFINYPRYPRPTVEIRRRAIMLGMRLMIGLDQRSFSVVGPDVTEWFTRREADLA